jgi:hypothetical protein
MSGKSPGVNPTSTRIGRCGKFAASSLAAWAGGSVPMPTTATQTRDGQQRKALCIVVSPHDPNAWHGSQIVARVYPCVKAVGIPR